VQKASDCSASLPGIPKRIAHSVRGEKYEKKPHPGESQTKKDWRRTERGDQGAQAGCAKKTPTPTLKQGRPPRFSFGAAGKGGKKTRRQKKRNGKGQKKGPLPRFVGKGTKQDHVLGKDGKNVPYNMVAWEKRARGIVRTVECHSASQSRRE